MSLNSSSLNSAPVNGSAGAGNDVTAFGDAIYTLDVETALGNPLGQVNESARLAVSTVGVRAFIGSVLESARLTDSANGVIISGLFERMRLSVLNFGRADASAAIIEALPLFERLRSILLGTLTETARLTENTTGQVLLMAALVEAIRQSDTMIGRRDAIAVLALALTFQDQAGPYNLAALVEALASSDALSAKLLANGAMVEAMVLAQAVVAGRVLLVTLPESFTLTDAASAKTTYSAAIAELLNTEAEFIIGGDLYQGWVVNTETNAPTEYENFPFNSMAKVGQRYYGAAENGLFLMGGTTDDGDPIRSRIVTGEMDFGSPDMKRLERAYMGYTTQGDLVLKVTVVHAGKRTEFWYKAAALTNGERTETRVKLGEGMVSRYWQFELVNSGGADFEIDRWDIDVRDLKRRV